MFVESGHAVCYLGNAKKQTLRDGTFYAEDPFITTLSMMVEENGDFNAAATSETQRMYGLQEVSDCHCLELGIKDVPSYVLFKDGERRGQWKGAFRVDQLETFLDGA